MGKIIFVTGGARSGKSSFAESIFKGEKEVVYIATSRIYDEEMQDRVAMHRQSRPQTWTTFEGCYKIADAVCDAKNYLLDCVTVLCSNIMFDITKDTDKISIEMQREVENVVMGEIQTLIDKVKKMGGNLVMVTNEVGCAIVPESHVGRVYRDIIGRVNQRTAALCDEVYFVVCGISQKIK